MCPFRVHHIDPCHCGQHLSISNRFPLVRPLSSTTSAGPWPGYPWLKNLCSAASQVLWACPTARKRTRWYYGLRPSPAGLTAKPTASHFPSSPGFRTWSVCTCSRSLTPGSWTGTRPIAPAHVAFPSARRGRHSQTVISELYTAPVHSPANASPRHHWSSTHSSGPERIATPYSVVDFHHLLHAGFCRRFPSVPYYIQAKAEKVVLVKFCEAS